MVVEKREDTKMEMKYYKKVKRREKQKIEELKVLSK